MKRVSLGKIEKCYSCLGSHIEGKPYIFFAGEGPGSLRAFYGENFSQETLIWEGGGGTMSIVAVPDEPKTFLASRGFYAMYQAEESTVEEILFSEGHFTYKTLVSLPVLHRFDVIKGEDGTRYLICCTLAESKESKEDWSKPGRIYVGPLEELREGKPLTELPGDFYQNHGFYSQGDKAYIGSREGAFLVTPPKKKNTEAADREIDSQNNFQNLMGWSIEKVLDGPVSDIALLDIDDDGVEEIAFISPFHGNEFSVVKDGKKIYTYPVESDFFHVAVAGTIEGKKVFIGGARKLSGDLFMLENGASGLSTTLVEGGCAPSNAAILNTESADILMAASRRDTGEALLYIWEK